MEIVIIILIIISTLYLGRNQKIITENQQLLENKLTKILRNETKIP
jgi:hypothetical protein